MKKYKFHKNDSIELICSTINQLGFAIVTDVYSKNEMNRVENKILESIQLESDFHGTKEYKDYGMLLACPIYGGAFLDILSNEQFMQPFNYILDETCIIYVYTSSSMPPKNTNYSNRIHVDRPHYNPNMVESLGSLICVNDFKKENGGTWVLPYSHLTELEPKKEYFYKNAIQIEAPAGSVFYFSLRLWHSGGDNHTDKWRHSLGIGMVKPYFKQRVDLPRAIPEKFAKNLSRSVKQKLGFYAQPPTSLESYYASIEKRTYQETSEWEKIKSKS